MYPWPKLLDNKGLKDFFECVSGAVFLVPGRLIGARAVIQSLAESIRDDRLRRKVLGSKPFLEL